MPDQPNTCQNCGDETDHALSGCPCGINNCALQVCPSCLRRIKQNLKAAAQRKETADA